jgi:glycosyltransferase involved in cell wall biosynthesis
MRILIAPLEIAGQASWQSMGLREYGHKVDTYFPVHSFGYKSPTFVIYPLRYTLLHIISRIIYGLLTIGVYDLYHYHYGASFFTRRLWLLDARINRLLGKKVIVEFWGSDIRKPSIENRRNKFYVNSYDESDERSDKLMRMWSEITEGHVIVADDSYRVALAPHFPHIHIAPLAIDVQAITPVYPKIISNKPVIVHIPSQLAFKGTNLVRNSINELRSKGVVFEYVELTGVSNVDAMAACRSADIVIDQICVGSHGVFAVEAMALGKPVVCYILPELINTYPEGFPIINANPENLTEILEDWLSDGYRRHEQGILSRQYAEKNHDSRVVAKKLTDIYKNLPD